MLYNCLLPRNIFFTGSISLKLIFRELVLPLVFGALFAHYFTDGYGRRYTFVAAAIGFIFGILIMVFSQSYGVLLFGRFFVGIGVGVGLAVSVLEVRILDNVV